MLTRLRARISEKTDQVGIVGLDDGGFPLCLLFAGEEFRTTGFDIAPAKADQLRQGYSYIKHIHVSALLLPTRNAGQLLNNELQQTHQAWIEAAGRNFLVRRP